MANNLLYDLDSNSGDDCTDNDSDSSFNSDTDITTSNLKSFGNPMYECYYESDGQTLADPTVRDSSLDTTGCPLQVDSGVDNTSDVSINSSISDKPGAGLPDTITTAGINEDVVRPKPRERTTIKRCININTQIPSDKPMISNKNAVIYSNVSQTAKQQSIGFCDDNNLDDSETSLNTTITSDEHNLPSDDNSLSPSDPTVSDQLPTLIEELEHMLKQMSTDSFYAIPAKPTSPAPGGAQTRPSIYGCSPPPTLPPKTKPRRRSPTETSLSSSSPATRPLPKPPVNVAPPKPPHLPPVMPPPPPPQTPSPGPSTPTFLSPAPAVPPRFPIKDSVLRDNVDLDDRFGGLGGGNDQLLHRKYSEPYRKQPKVPIVDPYYCQHSDCRLKGIARTQTVRSRSSSDKHSHHHHLEQPLKPQRLSPSSPSNNHQNTIIQKCGYLWKTGSNRREFLDRWCVLHLNEQQSDDGVLAYYVDRKTTSARGKILLKDIAFIRLLDTLAGSKTRPPTTDLATIDANNFCYFELGVNVRRGRVYLFAAKCLSDQRLWFNTICQSIAWDRFTLKDTFHCGYIHMKYGISGQWVTNYVLLSGRQLTVISNEMVDEPPVGTSTSGAVVDNKSMNTSEDSDSHMSTDSSSGSSHCYQTYDMRKVMSISYASVHQINSCSTVHESGQPLCLAFPNKVLYFQCDYKTHTELWYQAFLKLWTIPSNSTFEDQYLTNDSIPVAIDKCINFVSTYGTDTPNLYIQQNLQSPVVKALSNELLANAWDIQLRADSHSVHDITASLIMFLKAMSECILTDKLYHNWIKANEHENRNERLQKFKILLHLLPVVNYLTLKKLIAHLVCVIENGDKNQTTMLNMAPALCHSLLFLKCGSKIVDDRVSTFDGDSAGIDILTDLIQSYSWLFDVTAQELEKERRIQRALELLKEAKHRELGHKLNQKSVNDCQEFLIGVYIYSKEWGKCLNVKLTPQMTAKDLIDYVIKKANLKENTDKLSVYECVYNEKLERVLHYTDIVLGVTLAWVRWSQNYSHDNYLCVKHNRLYEQIGAQLADQTPLTIFSELRYADQGSKTFKKVLVEFVGAKLTIYKDENRPDKSLGQWCVEDITWYLGSDRTSKHRSGSLSLNTSNSSSNKKLYITFISRNNPIVKTKDNPYFGRVLCCNSEEEYHKWIAGMLCAEYPNGVIVNNSQRHNKQGLMD